MFKKRNIKAKPVTLDDINDSGSEELGQPQKKTKV